MKIKGFLTNSRSVVVSFFLAVTIVALALAVTGVYPFGEKQIAVIDMYHQYVPFLSELQYKLQEGGSLFYTWHGAGGSNFWTLLAYYGASPLNLLLAIFPQRYIMEGVTVILLIKIGLAASTMAVFLRSQRRGGGQEDANSQRKGSAQEDANNQGIANSQGEISNQGNAGQEDDGNRGNCNAYEGFDGVGNDGGQGVICKREEPGGQEAAGNREKSDAREDFNGQENIGNQGNVNGQGNALNQGKISAGGIQRKAGGARRKNASGQKKASDAGIVAFATLYALCSYVMAYYWCIMWLDAVVLLPLCILGLNRIIGDGRAVMYTVALGLTVFTNYYMAIMVCIFILCYYPVLYFLKVKNGGARVFFVTAAKAAGYSFLGVAMGAVMLLPTYISMRNAYYFSSDMPADWSFYNDVLDILNQLLPYAELTYREGLPNLYCGMLAVILAVLYVCNKSIALREKLLNLGFLAFLLLSLNINKLDFIWHGFHFPNQLPYRYTFAICFLLIGMAYRVFLRMDTVRVKHLWAVLAAGIGYYLLAQKLMDEQVDDMNLFFYGGVAWLALYGIVLILYRKGIIMKSSFLLLVVVLVAAEMGANTCESFERIGNTYRTSYFENNRDIRKLAEETNEEFARTEMDELYTLNDPAMYHYKGMSQFSSSINANMTRLMEKVGLDGSPGRNRFNYNQTSPVTNAMLNVKYIIAKNLEVKDPDFTQVEKSGHSRLYESKYPLSIGYMAGNEIRTWDTESVNPFDVLNDYVRAATSNTYRKVFYSVAAPAISAKNAKVEMTADGTFSVKSSDSNKSARVTLTYTSDKTQKYYVFFETASAKRINVSNGNKIDDIEIRNDCGSVVNIGSIEEGRSFTVTIDYEKGKDSTITGYVCYLEQEAWDGAYGILSQNLMRVTKSGDTFLEGMVEAEQDGVLVTSVPYEEGWRLTVDGTEQKIHELTGGVLISVPLKAGEHHIRLDFRPPGIAAGAAVSGIAIVLLAIFQLIERHRRKLLYEVRKAEDAAIAAQESMSDDNSGEISDSGM